MGDLSLILDDLLEVIQTAQQKPSLLKTQSLNALY